MRQILKQSSYWFGIFILGFAVALLFRHIQVLAESAVLKWDSPMRPFSRFYYLYVTRPLMVQWLAVFIFTVIMAYRVTRKSLSVTNIFVARRKAIVRGLIFYLGMYVFVPLGIVPWIGVIQTLMLILGLLPSNGPVSAFYVVQSLAMDAAMFTIAGAGATLIVARNLPIANQVLRWIAVILALLFLPIGRMCMIDTPLDQDIPLIFLDVIVFVLAISLWLWVKRGTLFSNSNNFLPEPRVKKPANIEGDVP